MQIPRHVATWCRCPNELCPSHCEGENLPTGPQGGGQYYDVNVTKITHHRSFAHNHAEIDAIESNTSGREWVLLQKRFSWIVSIPCYPFQLKRRQLRQLDRRSPFRWRESIWISSMTKFHLFVHSIHCVLRLEIHRNFETKCNFIFQFLFKWYIVSKTIQIIVMRV